MTKRKKSLYRGVRAGRLWLICSPKRSSAYDKLIYSGLQIDRNCPDNAIYIMEPPKLQQLQLVSILDKDPQTL